MSNKIIVHVGHGHKAKKSMGQNFLKSKEALLKMCKAGEVNNKDIIVEIGPGKGALTEKLLVHVGHGQGKVIAIEKDRDLMDILVEKFTQEIKNGKLILLNEDILGFDPAKYGLKEGGYKIIANIPYNITGSIIRRFLSEVNRPNTMTLLVQKEVAERVCVHVGHGHREGKESILSLSVKAYGEPKYIMKVHKRFFSPSPKVDSAIISINNISGKIFDNNKKKEENFFKIIKAGFAHKRKVLCKNLEVGLPDIEDIKEKIGKIFTELKIDTKARAEDVPFQKWLQITESFNKNT
jgi:16S rRNA (adenine1518-N6/adenine1519-N6)-dimethyltransferase